MKMQRHRPALLGSLSFEHKRSAPIAIKPRKEKDQSSISIALPVALLAGLIVSAALWPTESSSSRPNVKPVDPGQVAALGNQINYLDAMQQKAEQQRRSLPGVVLANRTENSDSAQRHLIMRSGNGEEYDITLNVTKATPTGAAVKSVSINKTGADGSPTTVFSSTTAQGNPAAAGEILESLGGSEYTPQLPRQTAIEIKVPR